MHNSVLVHVISGKNLSKASLSGLKEPYCRVTLGSKIWNSAHAKGNTLNPEFNSQTIMPYNGEPRLRFQIFDQKEREVGFHDFNLAALCQNDEGMTRTVQLNGPKGEAGLLNVSIRLSKEFAGKTEASPNPPKAAIAKNDIPRLLTPITYEGLRIIVGTGKDLCDVERFGKMDPYLKLHLGQVCMKSSVLHNAGTTNVDFSTIFEVPYANQRYLTIAVYDSGHLGDKLSASTILDLTAWSSQIRSQQFVELKTSRGKKGGVLDVTLEFLRTPIASPKIIEGKNKKIDQTLSDDGESGPLISTSSKSIQIQVVRISDIPYPPNCDVLNPFVSMRLGGIWLSSEAVVRGGGNCLIDSKFVFPYHQERHLLVSVMNRLSMGFSQLLGSAKVDLEQIMKFTDEHPVILQLEDSEKNKKGQLHCILRPSPLKENEAYIEESNEVDDIQSSCDSTVEDLSRTVELQKYTEFVLIIQRVENLLDPQMFGKMDPYVKCKIGTFQLKSPVRRDAGPTADIQTQFVFPYHGESKLKIEAFDRERLIADRLIGIAELDLELLLHQQESAKSISVSFLGVGAKHKGELAGKVILSYSFKKNPEAGAAVIDLLAEKKDNKGAGKDSTLDDKSKASQFKSLEMRLISLHYIDNTHQAQTYQPLFRINCGLYWLDSRTIPRSNLSQQEISQLFIFPYDGNSKVKLQLFNRHSIHKNVFLGSAVFHVDPFSNFGQSPTTQSVQLLGQGGSPKAEVSYEIKFIESWNSPAVICLPMNTKDAVDNGLVPQADHSYLQSVAILISQFHSMTGTSMNLILKAYLGGMTASSRISSDSAFNTQFIFPWHNEKEMKLFCYDHHRFSKDRLLGTATVKLDQYLQNGHQDQISVNVLFRRKSNFVLQIVNSKVRVGKLDVAVHFSKSEVTSPYATISKKA